MEDNNEKLIERENAKSFIRRISRCVHTIESQINNWIDWKRNFLKNFGIGNGIITGLFINLFTSDIQKNIFLLFLGFTFLIAAEIYWVLSERKSIFLTRSYIKHLTGINKKLINFSSQYNKFLRFKDGPTYKEITENFLSNENYSELHDNQVYEEIEKWRNEEIKNDRKINILIFCFICGLSLIVLSLAFPYFEILLRVVYYF